MRDLKEAFFIASVIFALMVAILAVPTAIIAAAKHYYGTWGGVAAGFPALFWLTFVISYIKVKCE